MDKPFKVYRPRKNTLFLGSANVVTFLDEYDHVMDSIRPDELNMLDIFSNLECEDEKTH